MKARTTAAAQVVETKKRRIVGKESLESNKASFNISNGDMVISGVVSEIPTRVRSTYIVSKDNGQIGRYTRIEYDITDLKNASTEYGIYERVRDKLMKRFGESAMITDDGILKVTFTDEEIISNSKNLYKSFKTAKRLIRHIQVVKHYLDKIITAKAERAANKAAKKAAAKN